MNTKEQLAQALKQMMLTQPVDHITINQLVAEAAVARNTFYYHFQDINALLAWIYDAEIVQPLMVYTRRDQWAEGLDLLLSYIEDNRKFCLNTFRSLSRDVLDHFLYQVAFAMVTGVINDLAPQCPKQLRQEIGNFYGWALSIQVIQWLVNGLTESHAVFRQRMERMLRGTISHVIKHNQ
ncbi:MAG TPA: TetR family transcriptional regulator [Lactobacillus sp.]|nr:TetR family transcriptional regulator [Lactobacillus sp.]